MSVWVSAEGKLCSRRNHVAQFKVAISSRRSIIASSGRRFSFRVQIFTNDKALAGLAAVIKRAHFYSFLNHYCSAPDPIETENKAKRGH